MTRKTVEDAIESLTRVQTYDLNKLPRNKDLGEKLNFEEAVQPAQRLIDLFTGIPSQALDEFPDQEVSSIKNRSDSVFKIFEQIESFDVTQQNSIAIRSSIISNLSNQYESAFRDLMPIISYAASRTIDFSLIENEGRIAIEEIEERTAEVIDDLEETKSKADKTLNEIRTAAAELGVSQEAIHFSKEQVHHDTKAKHWGCYTIGLTIVLTLYGVSSFFLHKIPYIAPENTSEAILFVTSKILIFVILSYMLIFSTRNFLSHKHNSVVNKHRQNALLTYRVLVEAGTTAETQNIVLNYAASCIYAPQDTGYIKNSGTQTNQTGRLVDMIPRSSVTLNGQ